MTARPRLRLAAYVVSLALVLNTGPARADPVEKPAPAVKKPNVLLITVDTLRADHLGAYGYGLETSPEFDRLAAEGVLFTDAITPVPTTAPALASLLTGRHADGHGVRENLGELPATVDTLAEAFLAADFRTAGFFGNGAVQHGFGQGFEVFEPFADHWFFRDRAGSRKALAWLAAATEPWFLWIHFMDPHGPYSSSKATRSAAFTYPDTPRFQRVLPAAKGNFGYGVMPKYQKLPGHERVVDYVRRYDGEVLGTDQEIGRIRSFLQEKGMLDHTILIVTADHGEGLGEDEYFFQHGHLLHEPAVRVPLLMRYPPLGRGLRTDVPASLVDLFPTLSRLTGIPLPEGAEGRDLSRELGAARANPEITRVSYTVTPNRKTSIRKGPWELRGTPRDKRPPDEFARIELFDRRTDPPTLVPTGERVEIRNSLEPELRAAAKRVRKNNRTPRAPTTEEKERLRALGYID